MMKTLKWIAVGLLVAVGAQAAIVTDNLAQELNADDIGAVTNGSTWTARTGANATLHDVSTEDLTKAAATVDGGQTNSLFSNTLNKDVWSRAGALGATTTYLTGTTLSVELWARPNFTGIPATSHTIFETGGPTRGLSITLGDNGSGTNNTLRFAMKDASNSAYVDVPLDAAAMADFTDGHHHQLVATYDNVNNMSLYIDGALAGSNTTAGVIDWDGTSIAGFWGQDGTGLGADAIALDDAATGSSTNGYGNGSIAVFRQYSDVLSVAEVLQNYTTTSPNYYVGSGALIDVVYDNTAGTIGSIDSTNSNSWSSGLPSDSNPGLFDGTVGDGTAELSSASAWWVWYGVAVRQTGGTLSQANHTMRGGAEDGSSTNCILEIDDASNDGSYTNLAISGQLTMWNQNGAAGATGNTLSVLNGYADVGILAATASADEFINILNGRLDVGYFSNARVTVNMLDGGTGEFNLADMYVTGTVQANLDQMILNFESGSEASFTILASNVTGNAQGAWETKVAAGQVQIDGVAVTDLSQFVIEDVDVTGTRISLDIDPPTPNPAGFARLPTAISSSELWMTATVGSDASGVVEYLFTETSGNPGGASSGWQYSPNFTADGLSPDTQYSYTVTMRDAFGNTGTVSSAVAATTRATDPSGPELRPSRVFVATSGEHTGNLVRYDAAGNPVLLKAFGVNYQTAFLLYIDDVNDTSFIAGFEYLRDHYIPVARVLVAGFWPKDWNLYFTDKTEYFRRMDYFIAQAEHHGIGLILDLFWSVDTLGELVDDAVVAGYLTPGVDFVPPSPLNLDEFGAETYDEYKRAMGRPDSGSNAFIALYTREMVERYRNSPAIWGWEFGNEYNLKVDHPNVPNKRVRWGGAAVGMTLADSNTNLVVLPAWTGPDDLVRSDVLVAKTNFAHTVRSIDPWRLITSGDAKSLTGAYHNWTEHTWTKDSRAEHAQVLPVDNPAPMDTVSVHIYPAKPGADPDIYFTDDPVTNSWVTGQYKELLDYFMAESAALGRPLIVGEWGGIGDGTTADEKTTFHRWMQALMDSGVQLSLMWNFDNTHLNQIDYWWVNPGTPKEYQLTNEDPDLWDLEQANLYVMAGYERWDWSFAQADLSDPTADYDLDGVVNLMEYALGGNPTLNDAAAVLPVFQPLENHFYYVHNERTDDTNLIYTVQACTNLVSNGWNTNGLEFVGAAGFSNVWEVVTNKVSTLEKDQQFIRLKIEKD